MQPYTSREDCTLLTVLEKQDTEASSMASESAINTSGPAECMTATGPVIPYVYMIMFI